MDSFIEAHQAVRHLQQHLARLSENQVKYLEAKVSMKMLIFDKKKIRLWPSMEFQKLCAGQANLDPNIAHPRFEILERSVTVSYKGREDTWSVDGDGFYAVNQTLELMLINSFLMPRGLFDVACEEIGADDVDFSGIRADISDEEVVDLLNTVLDRMDELDMEVIASLERSVARYMSVKEMKRCRNLPMTDLHDIWQARCTLLGRDIEESCLTITFAQNTATLNLDDYTDTLELGGIAEGVDIAQTLAKRWLKTNGYWNHACEIKHIERDW